ncbi:hypothetical protein TWF106_003558, partial [Orbilia oligospora]
RSTVTNVSVCLQANGYHNHVVAVKTRYSCCWTTHPAPVQTTDPPPPFPPLHLSIHHRPSTYTQTKPTCTKPYTFHPIIISLPTTPLPYHIAVSLVGCQRLLTALSPISKIPVLRSSRPSLLFPSN